MRVTVPLDEAAGFAAAARAAGWDAVDTGERITTEDGIDKEAVLYVRIPSPGADVEGVASEA